MASAPRCLLVDDDPHFRAYLHYIVGLLCPRLDLIEFGNGSEALEYFGRTPVHLIITDYRMPELDGLELTAAIRMKDLRVPIFLISSEDVGGQAAARGATVFLHKLSLATELKIAMERSGILTEFAGADYDGRY